MHPVGYSKAAVGAMCWGVGAGVVSRGFGCTVGDGPTKAEMTPKRTKNLVGPEPIMLSRYAPVTDHGGGAEGVSSRVQTGRKTDMSDGGKRQCY